MRVGISLKTIILPCLNISPRHRATGGDSSLFPQAPLFATLCRENDLGAIGGDSMLLKTKERLGGVENKGTGRRPGIFIAMCFHAISGFSRFIARSPRRVAVSESR